MGKCHKLHTCLPYTGFCSFIKFGCRFNQEHVLRLAEVGPALTQLHVDALLMTAGTTAFHPLLPLSDEDISEQKTRILRISNRALLDQQLGDLDELTRYRDKAAKAHIKQHGSCNFATDIKAGTAAIKALVVSEEPADLHM